MITLALYLHAGLLKLSFLTSKFNTLKALRIPLLTFFLKGLNILKIQNQILLKKITIRIKFLLNLKRMNFALLKLLKKKKIKPLRTLS